MSTLHEIGSAVRARRTEMGLTQDLLARISGLSRSTVNAVERQSISNLSIAKAVALLESIGLSMNVTVNRSAMSPFRKSAPLSRSALERAAATATASVSFEHAMNAKQLEVALLTGEAPQRIRSHLQVMLDEAPVSLLAKVVDQIHIEKAMPRAQVWNQMRNLAHELQCYRLLWQ
ncbi:transcriptional regulator, XRE family [Variovorax sp. YR752]|uniref:helix-turn-helix domain-containing protein n=1 Tax=Variovorax sp. YR752 TaxID=1884383 RepID=UPI000BC4A919|nr:helix-turn-helix domain-containing protein [Variovorax sp. YR752]SOE06403.1 transcriptional regulator, XRE family [Variovorax sp. YR752]